MRPIMKLTICTFAAAAMAAPAFAANYLKIGDVKSRSATGSTKPVPSGVEGGQQIEIQSWSWGATQAGSWDGTIKGRTGENAAASGEQVAAGDVNADGRADVITSPRDTASGMPTGKRQHGWVKISKPLDRGSVTVKGSMSGCTVGAAYPDAVLQTAAARYEFTDVLITSCSMSGSAIRDRPMESLSFNYTKMETVYTP